MEVIDNMLEYMKNGERSKLIRTNQTISDCELRVVIVNILSWLRLEHKRGMWMAQGKNVKFKPLKVEKAYSWCMNARELIQSEKQFQDCFALQNEEITFSDNVSEKERKEIRENVFNHYKPSVHVLRRPDQKELEEFKENKVSKADEKKLLFIIQDILEAFEKKRFSNDEPKKLLFSSEMIHLLKKLQCNEKIIELAENVCELSGTAALISEKSGELIAKLQNDTYKLLTEYDARNPACKKDLPIETEKSSSHGTSSPWQMTTHGSGARL